jgi:hypothetical protein
MQTTKSNDKLTTGAFKRKLHDVYPSSTHYRRALRNIKHVKVDANIKNVRNQSRKYAAQVLDELMKVQ